jgi:hypothetical protein
VRSWHTHFEHWQNLQQFLLYLSVIQTQHISFRLLSASFTNAMKLIVSKPHPLLSFPRSMSEEIPKNDMSFNEPIFIKQSPNILEISFVLRTLEIKVMRTLF